MKHLVLGASGFIGRNLIESILNNSQDELILFDKVETIFGREISAEQKKRCRIIKDNFQLSTNFEQLTAGIDTVYHLISTTLPNNSNQNIGMGLMDNVIVTASFLDACVKNGVKRVLFLSSGGTVYGVSAKMP